MGDPATAEPYGAGQTRGRNDLVAPPSSGAGRDRTTRTLRYAASPWIERHISDSRA